MTDGNAVSIANFDEREEDDVFCVEMGLIERPRPLPDVYAVWMKCKPDDLELAVSILSSMKHPLIDKGYVCGFGDAEQGFAPDDDGETTIASLNGDPNMPCLYFVCVTPPGNLKKFTADVMSVVRQSDYVEPVFHL